MINEINKNCCTTNSKELTVDDINVTTIPEHSTHFHIGSDNPKVEGGILQNQYAKQSRILLSL